jgi:hypothetical protein
MARINGYIIFRGDELNPEMFTGFELDETELDIVPNFEISKAHIYKSLYAAKSDAKTIQTKHNVKVSIMEVTFGAVYFDIK